MVRSSLDALGRNGMVVLEEFGRFFIFLSQVVRWLGVTLANWWNWMSCAMTGRPRPCVLEVRETFDQMVIIGVDSIPVVLITAFFTGMVLALQTGYILEDKLRGISQFLGGLVTLSMVRELGPVVICLIVTGRVGSAMAAEIGTMRVTEQIDAFVTLSTSPIKYLVVPRLLACVAMAPLLVLFADAVGVYGGLVIAQTKFDQSAATYILNIQDMVGLGDLFGGLFKAAFFGVIIATVSCHKGFNASGGAEGVGRATTSAVVIASIAILIADYFLTAAMGLV